MARARRAASNGTPGSRASAPGSAEFKCPECGRSFARAAALGAHRRQAHGVAGTSAASTAGRQRRSRQSRSGTASASPRRASRNRTSGSGNARNDGVNRDALIAAIFPQGVPPRESVIREVARWLDDAERLAALR